MMPLTMLNTGEPSTIKKVGGKEETRRFLENLGFVPGGEVTVVSRIQELRSEKTWRIKLWYKTVATAQFHDTKMKRSETMKTLKEVACGSTVKVKKLTGEGPVKRRIMDMGITKGVDIYVRKVAPLGDPIEVTVRGYELSLRKADAEMIEVE